jgi:hypothetical protein
MDGGKEVYVWANLPRRVWLGYPRIDVHRPRVIKANRRRKEADQEEHVGKEARGELDEHGDVKQIPSVLEDALCIQIGPSRDEGTTLRQTGGGAV